MLGVPADVTKEDVANLWATVAKEIGAVDILINNADSLTQSKSAKITPDFASYTPSKLAAAKYIEFLYAEQPAVRCISVFPGLGATDMPPKEYLDMALDDPMLMGGLSLWLCTGRGEWSRGFDERVSGF